MGGGNGSVVVCINITFLSIELGFQLSTYMNKALMCKAQEERTHAHRITLVFLFTLVEGVKIKRARGKSSS